MAKFCGGFTGVSGTVTKARRLRPAIIQTARSVGPSWFDQAFASFFAEARSSATNEPQHSRRLKSLNVIAPGTRAPQPGAPMAWVTTQRFLEVFALGSLNDLPDLEALGDHGARERDDDVEAALDDTLGLEGEEGGWTRLKPRRRTRSGIAALSDLARQCLLADLRRSRTKRRVQGFDQALRESVAIKNTAPISGWVDVTATEHIIVRRYRGISTVGERGHDHDRPAFGGTGGCGLFIDTSLDRFPFVASRTVTR
jgi:hypothetical protein